MSYPNDHEHLRLAVAAGVAVVPWPRLGWLCEGLTWHGGRVGTVIGMVDPDRLRRDGHPSIPDGLPSFAASAYDVEDATATGSANREAILCLLDAAAQAEAGSIVVCCCLGGISRSTALAVTVLAQRLVRTGGKDACTPQFLATAIDAVRKQRPPMSPNRLILSHAGSVLGVGDRLVTAVEGDPELLKRYTLEGRGLWADHAVGKSNRRR